MFTWNRTSTKNTHPMAFFSRRGTSWYVVAITRPNNDNLWPEQYHYPPRPPQKKNEPTYLVDIPSGPERQRVRRTLGALIYNWALKPRKRNALAVGFNEVLPNLRPDGFQEKSGFTIKYPKNIDTTDSTAGLSTKGGGKRQKERGQLLCLKRLIFLTRWE